MKNLRLSGLVRLGFVMTGVAIVFSTDGVLSSASSNALTKKDILVDCVLPGQVQKLGRKLFFLTPHTIVRTSAPDCEIRGGLAKTIDPIETTQITASFNSDLGWSQASSPKSKADAIRR